MATSSTTTQYGNSRGGRRTFANPWLVPLVIAGFIASAILTTIVGDFAKYGFWAALAAILLGPAFLLVGVLAIREFRRKWAVLRPKLHWWHLLWFLLSASTLVWRVRDQGAIQENPLDAWAMLRIIPETVVFGWLLVRFTRRRAATAWLKSLFGGVPGRLTCFALVCITSTLWSVFAAWTLFKSLEYMLDLLVLAAVLANVSDFEDYESLFGWTWTIFGVELAWVWMQIPLWPGNSFEDGRLKGYFPSTAYNYVGQSGAIMAIIAVCRLFPVRGAKRENFAFSTALLAFGCATLIACQTRNTIAAFAFAVVVVIILTRRTWILVASAVAGAGAWFLTPLGDMVLTYLQRDQSRQAMEEMTGRAELWSFAWQEFLKHPINGMGAYAAGRFFIMTKLGKDTASLHSDWVELLVGVGLLGLIPFVLALGGAWWHLVRSSYDKSLEPAQRQLVLEAVGVLGVITIHSIFNDELTWHAPLLFLVVLGCAEMLRRRRQAVMVRAPLPLFAPAVSPGYLNR